MLRIIIKKNKKGKKGKDFVFFLSLPKHEDDYERSD